MSLRIGQVVELLPFRRYITSIVSNNTEAISGVRRHPLTLILFINTTHVMLSRGSNYYKFVVLNTFDLIIILSEKIL